MRAIHAIAVVVPLVLGQCSHAGCSSVPATITRTGPTANIVETDCHNVVITGSGFEPGSELIVGYGETNQGADADANGNVFSKAYRTEASWYEPTIASLDQPATGFSFRLDIAPCPVAES